MNYTIEIKEGIASIILTKDISLVDLINHVKSLFPNTWEEIIIKTSIDLKTENFLSPYPKTGNGTLYPPSHLRPLINPKINPYEVTFEGTTSYKTNEKTHNASSTSYD